MCLSYATSNTNYRLEVDTIFPPYVRSSRPLARQTTNNLDTTHHNTTSQRRKSLVGFVRWILDVSAPASGVLTALLSFDYLQRKSSPDRADDRIYGRESLISV
jgi:hypothetical protein